MMTLIDEIDALFLEWDRPDSPGCALGIIQDGQLVYARGYGLANLDYDVPITPDSVFYIASTSKQFVAANIVLLAQRGALSLDENVREYVPEVPGYDHPITVRHMVHHISGLRDYLALMELAGRRHEDYFNLDDAMEIIARQKALNFRPGERFLYCNSGYALMAEIVKRVSGQSLRKFADENIFRPLNMSSTHFDDDYKIVVKNRVVSYAAFDEGGYQRYLKNFDAVGSGGLLTTVNDLYHWDQNFYRTRKGDSEFLSQMLTRGQLTDGEILDYAFGLEHGEYRGLKTVHHAGTMLGFRTQILRFPEQRISVICLANLETINPTRLAQQVADILLADALVPEPALEPQLTDLDESDLHGFVGLYRNAKSGAFVELLLEGGQLMAEAIGLNLPLVAVSTHAFRAQHAYVDVHITFETDARTQRSPLSMAVNGDELEDFQPVDVTSYTPDQLADYVGAFCSDELQVTYEFECSGAELFCRYRNGPDGPLKPGPRDLFWLPTAAFAFFRDEGGLVSGFTLDSERARHLRFHRI